MAPLDLDQYEEDFDFNGEEPPMSQFFDNPDYNTRPEWRTTISSLIHIVEPPAASPLEPTPAPAPGPSTSSSELSSAPEDGPTQLSLPSTQTSPPPHYNPYPYDRTWRLYRPVLGAEQYLWFHRDDEWMKFSMGGTNAILQWRIFSQIVLNIREKQRLVRKEWEEEQVRARSPPIPMPTTPPRELEHLPIDPESLIDRRFDMEFMTASEEKGIPMRTLLSTRRVIQMNIPSPRGKVFENYYQDNIWVRIKWPAYPDHEPARSVLVTMRASGKIKCKGGGRAKRTDSYKPYPRRPCTRLELCVALAALITRYYNEASAMEPHPAFEHLAFGSGEGRVSLYGLRMMALRAAENGIYDLQLELDTSESDTQDSSEPADGVKIIEPSCSDTLPVTCTVAPPPSIPHNRYFTHLDIETLGSHIIPIWQP